MRPVPEEALQELGDQRARLALQVREWRQLGVLSWLNKKDFQEAAANSSINPQEMPARQHFFITAWILIVCLYCIELP